MKKIDALLHDSDPKVIKTVIKSGITLKQMSWFAKSLGDSITDYKRNGRIFVPGAFLTAKFRNIVKIIHQENSSFPFDKIDSFFGSYPGGTLENTLYIDEGISYRLKYLSEDDRSSPGKKVQYIIEIERNRDHVTILQGIFQFIKKI